MNYKIIDQHTGHDAEFSNERIASFLFEHLDQFGDKEALILKCIEYVFAQGRGGFITIAYQEGSIGGAVIVNETGMSGYIPENMLVYIAVDKVHRGKGVGKELMQTAINRAKGSIALHVEPDNPAKGLYEKLGFTNKYLEMRLQR